MTRHFPVAAVCAAAFVAACAGGSTTSTPAPTAPPAAPPAAAPPTVAPPVTRAAPPDSVVAFDPAGTYELQLTFSGGSLPVTLELWQENGQWRGWGGNSQVGSADLSDLRINGRSLRITLVAQNGPTFVMDLTVKADQTVEGSWSGGGDGSSISGRKTK
jgi:hypothetical protein